MRYIFILSLTAFVQLSIAFTILYVDHIVMPIVSWGHVCWHITAALAIDNIYQSIIANYKR